MKILGDLIQAVSPEINIESVLVGAHWTVVQSHNYGMASTVISYKPHGEERVSDVGQLTQKTAHELANYVFSDNTLEAGIGLAAINSTIIIDENNLEELGASDVLIRKGSGKRISLVGHFPFIPELKKAAKELFVLELFPSEGGIFSRSSL